MVSPLIILSGDLCSAISYNVYGIRTYSQGSHRSNQRRVIYAPNKLSAGRVKAIFIRAFDLACPVVTVVPALTVDVLCR